MYLLTKRIIDILIAGVALLVFLPILIPVVILLKLTAERKVFFLQKRVGLHNNEFNIIKLATMLENSANMKGGSITLRGDSRITPIGRILRKLKLNEIPQILNVLNGDMSIVGPRPLTKKSTLMYTDEVRSKIYTSKPGITGIGSVVFRDEEFFVSRAKNNGIDPRTFYATRINPYKGELEMWYRDNKSMFVDFAIIFITAWNILFSKSDLAYSVFGSLPEKPDFLKL